MTPRRHGPDLDSLPPESRQAFEKMWSDQTRALKKMILAVVTALAIGGGSWAFTALRTMETSQARADTYATRIETAEIRADVRRVQELTAQQFETILQRLDRIEQAQKEQSR